MEELLTNSMAFLARYFWLIFAWSIYFFMHSLLATTTVKDNIRSWGISERSQRIFYVLLSTAGLFVLLLYNGMFSGEPLFIKTGIIKFIAIFCGAVGVLILNASFKQYNLSGFLGVSEEQSALKKDGILGVIRHPLYTATIFISIGFFLFDPRIATLISVICIYLYLLIGIRLEEKKLTKKFGQLYIDYKKEVPALFPNIFNLLEHITKN